MEKPEIRFKGYTDEWEQRKLGDVTESIKNGYTYKADGSREHLYKITRIESISSGAINIEKLGSSDNVNENYKLEDGDILFSHINSLPYIANTAIYTSNLGEIYHGMNLLNIRAKHEIIDSHFLLHLLKKESSRNWFRIIAKPAVNQASISTTEVSSFVFMMPNMEEQKRISSVLDNIDNLLTLHQRKCDEVKTLNKYMLQKMFPQNEQKVPEIRFEGFTEAWEQRKLGDLVDRVTRKNQDLVSELPLTISAQYGLIDQNEFFDKRVASKDVSGYYLIENGEFAYNKSTSTDAPWGAIKRLDRYENGVLSTLYIIFGIKENNPVDSDFLVSYYSTNLWHKGIHEIAAEGARNHGLLNIAPADFFETKLMIPQDIEEQKKIGKYFEELERLITLHQRKPIPHPNHPTTHTKHKGEEKYVRIRVNDREKTNRTANLWRFPVDIPGGFKDGGGSVGEFQIYSGAE